ncbi:MAG: hypothetical protein RL059_1573, partial [Bacteroidota bacterium]
MSNYTVSCPKCYHSFEPTDAIREEVEKELRGKMTDWQKKKEEETNQLLADQKLKIENELSEQLKKNLAEQYEHKLKLAHEGQENMGKQVKEFQEKELAYLKKEQAMQTREAELEIELQRKLNTERESLKVQIQKEEADRLSIKEQEHTLKVKELEKKLEDQQKLAEEMRRD